MDDVTDYALLGICDKHDKTLYDNAAAFGSRAIVTQFPTINQPATAPDAALQSLYIYIIILMLVLKI